jgi:hypothetical protein
MTREQMLSQLARRGFDASVLGRGMSTEALSSLVRFSERRPVRVRTTCYRQFTEDGQGDDDADLDVDRLVNEIGRRGGDATPYLQLLATARSGRPATEQQVLAVITETLRISEPDQDPTSADEFGDLRVDDGSAMTTSGFSDADVAAGAGMSRTVTGMTANVIGDAVPRKSMYAEARRYYQAFAESFKAAGVSENQFVRDRLRFGWGEGDWPRPPKKPTPPTAKKYAEQFGDSDTIRVAMHFDRHAGDYAKFGIQRADLLSTFAASGQTATQFLKGV